MAKNEIKPLIIEVLKEKEEPITLKKLTKEIRNKRSKTGDTSIKENLLNLLRNRRVRIDVIDYEDKNKSTQKSENNKKRSISQKAFFDILTFELIKEKEKHFTGISNLLKELLENKNNDARTKLEIIFEEKIKSIEKEWKEYEGKLEFIDLPKEVITFLRAKDAITKKIVDTNYFPDEPELSKSLKTYYYDFLNKYDDENYEKYEFRKIRKLSDEEIPKMPITKNLREFYSMNLAFNPNMKPEICRKKEIEHYTQIGEPEVIVTCWGDLSIPLTDEEFLEKRLGYPKPTKRNKKEIKSLFSDIIRYLFLSKELPDKKIEEIIWALSDEEGSGQLLNQIIHEVTNGKKSI